MKSLLHIFLTIMALMPLAAAAQDGPNDADRRRWYDELRTLKHDFLARELELSDEQQDSFFPIYVKMEDEIATLNRQTRRLELSIDTCTTASDLELTNAARTIFEQGRAEGQIEMTYFEQFQQILNPRQLLRLKNAERKFNQQLVKHHRRLHRLDEPSK